ncbi:BTAD domain-containing putative transcriptional regulator [Myceligenerans pegani]|uniref:Winged helix-turn-helix domain-containing protein n=1 Tax=Myceligenerans pegani TaxID=2776917 RepID=A0ABR9N2C3_9MICO|nr:BTAD domain-containing putative transcriptional regulator [Myceligenerans sp. TRM 65318]MBE1877299.1 winged helix-turn-helix domain-containing protein [Myceligenerans sp. TRM 65318]MBE3019570.1 winged helix-turn-helix domain-containing protein [Myceligenerans sp. TRM 65318]
MVDHNWSQPRPGLDRRLDGALTHRLTTLVAAAGYGKSTVLSAWVRAVGGAAYRIGPADQELTGLSGGVISALRLRAPALPSEIVTAVDAPLGPDAVAGESARASALAGALSEALGAHLTGSLVLVLDGLEGISGSPAASRFVETLVRTAPPHLHIVISSRDVLPFPIARLRQVHEVLEFDATDLTLTPQETADWLRRRIGDAAAGVASALHAATGGWPAATHAAVDAMARTDPDAWADVVAVAAATSEALDQLARRAFDALPAEPRFLLRAATVAPVVTDQLATALGVAPDTLPGITSRGLFMESGADGSRLTPVGLRVLHSHAPLEEHEAHDVAEVAARWYVEHGATHHAAQAAVAARHDNLIESLLADHGEALVEHPDDLIAALARIGVDIGGGAADGDEASGAGGTGARPAGRVNTEQGNTEHLRLAGLAHFHRGDWDAARALLLRAGEASAFDSAVAYRLGIIEHLRGELHAALDVYRRGAELGRPAADAAVCTAMAAAVRWLQGDRAECAALADTAREQATRLGDDRALAAVHTVLAMLAAYDGDGRANDAHYLKALDHAARAGDVAQQIRIRSNRASRQHTAGAFTEALAELEIAIRLCDLTGFAPWAALARSNRAETLIRLGRLEEAAVEAGDAVERWEAMGARLMGYGLTQQAQIHVLRGHPTAAASAFRRAAEIAEQAGDAQARGTALAGLAELLAADDPAAAADLAAQAAEHHVGTALVSAWLAGARAAITGGRPDDARRLLDGAEAEAARRNERASLARAAELRAELDGDVRVADQAVQRWRTIGDPIGLARAELVRATLGPARPGAEVAEGVRSRMHAIGCRALDGEIEALASRASASEEPRIVVQTLGTFRVLRDGVPVPTAAWQSRKARDLLKVLVTRRGRPVSRDQLAEILWPDAGADAVSLKRLNVMVSTVRGVLDPDHSWPADHIVASTSGSLHVELDHVHVDVVDFLDRVAEATALDQADRRAEALDRWRAAEAAYTGDFCEEDAYADWATTLREEARLAYAQAAARIADQEAGAGHYEEAARYWLRLLERDPYDERAHLALILALDQAGRRGDARRRYQVYADLMRELDIEPSPHPV